MIDAVAGSNTQNSYVSLVDANAYFEARLHSTNWTTATDEVKTAALLQATRLFDVSFSFKGRPTTATQALSFPREYILKVDRSLNDNDIYIDKTIIPQGVVNAVCEIAYLNITNDVFLDTRSTSNDLKEAKIGSISVKLASENAKQVYTDLVSLYVSDLIECDNNSSINFRVSGSV